MTKNKYPKSFYQVFQCSDANNPWSYDETLVLFEHDDLSEAHYFAHTEWLKDNTKIYTIIQPYDGAYRGGYGFPEEE